METSEYNRDQIEAFSIVRRYFRDITKSEMSQIKRLLRPYLQFRSDLSDFQDRYLSEICTQKCFANRNSACCNREGIATFFADVVINTLLSSEEERADIITALAQDRGGFKCVYLADKGCLWRVKPIVCEMFLCKHAKDSVFANRSDLLNQWERLRRRERRYTWPTRPVLFDRIEKIFIRKGFDSPLMYFHHGPGLLRIKARHHVP
jgi:hypothetical protein